MARTPREFRFSPGRDTRPQWIIPHGGAITVDGIARRVVADHS
jgi:hypothetical protein